MVDTNKIKKIQIEMKTEELMAKPQKTQLIQMRLPPATLEKISGLKRLMDTGKRTDVIRFSIDIADLVLKEMASGTEVILEKNGVRKKLTVPKG